MLGTGQTMKDGKTVEFEFMRIHEEKGEILFTAKPSGQPEASFKLISYKDGKAIFENPQHDFPQRVIYGKQPDGGLLARRNRNSNWKTSPGCPVVGKALARAAPEKSDGRRRKAE